MRRNSAFFWVSAAYAVAVGLALQAGLVFSDVVVTSGIYFILVMGLDSLYGYAGLLSLGHIGFFTIGAYTVGILAKFATMGFFASALIATCHRHQLGLLLGWVFLRLRGSYFMLGTLAFGLVCACIAHRLVFGDGRATTVSVACRGPSCSADPLVSDTELRRAGLDVALVLFWLAVNLTRSRVGRALLAIRSDEVSAASVGDQRRAS